MTVKTPFRVYPVEGGWAAEHIARPIQNFGSHCIIVEMDEQNYAYRLMGSDRPRRMQRQHRVMVLGRCPFEAIERLKRKLKVLG